ncbi:hypothetical protein HK100_009568 [Physocladia obscura]|uniref:Uncharacterized protein n=1 Tax=Physocladia obscura TaxID=109957 RepID=A0AAD5X9N7_9FUNG|nr:hypothetical protein HK100_009568 [Physocladia obscura]
MLVLSLLLMTAAAIFIQANTTTAVSATSAVVSPWDVPAVYPLVGQGAVFGIDESNAISWINNETDATAAQITKVELVLGTGSANAVTEMYNIGQVPFPSTTCFDWIPTANLTNPQYTIVFKGTNDNGVLLSVNYVTWFQLATTGVTATYCSNSTSSVVTTAATASSSPSYLSQTATVNSSSVLSVAAVTAANAVGGSLKSDAGVSLIGFYCCWRSVAIGSAFLILMS